MTMNLQQPNDGFIRLFAVSLLLHGLFLAAVTMTPSFTMTRRLEPACYIDLGTVRDEQSVTPPAVDLAYDKNEPAAPSKAPAMAKQAALPRPVQASGAGKPALPAQEAAVTQEAEYEKRLAEMKKKIDEDAFNKTIRDLGGKKPSVTKYGVARGSSYLATIHGLLQEEFRATITWRSAAPEVLIKIIIDREGHLVTAKIVKSTGDRLFEGAVQRAVELATRRFTAPPPGLAAEFSFVFKPEAIANE